MKRTLLKASLTGTALLATRWTVAQPSKERTLKFVTQNPQGHPIELGMRRFAELVKQYSDGRIQVRLFPGGTLGNDAQNVSALQGGTIEMASMNTGILASQIKDFEVFDYPFMFANFKEADAVADGPVGKGLHDRLQTKGLVGLGYWDLGFRNITNRVRPVNRLEDLAGLKLRVIPNAINIEWVKAVGANPTPLPWPEVYSALEQRAIDAQENPLTVIEANKLYEVQKHLAITNHVYNPQSILVSQKFWNSLSDDERGILSQAATESVPYQREQSRKKASAALDSLRKNGMAVTRLSAVELDRFRERVRPVLQKQGEAVAATLKAMQAELADQRR